VPDVHRLQYLIGDSALLVFHTHSVPCVNPHPPITPPDDGVLTQVAVPLIETPLMRKLRQDAKLPLRAELQSHCAPARRPSEEQVAHELAMKASRTRRISPSVTCVLIALYPPTGAQYVGLSIQYPEIPQSPLGPGHVVICDKALSARRSVASLVPKHVDIASVMTKPATFCMKGVPTALVSV